MKRKSLALYFHGSSKNHGCEAIIRSTVKILKEYDITLFSDHPEDDEFYGLDRIVRVSAAGIPAKRYSPYRLLAGFCLKVGKSAKLKCRQAYRNLLSHSDFHAAISIGGDNYCYPGSKYPLLLRALNSGLNRRGVRTVLWGCSIEPDLLADKRLLVDLNRYSLITTRESITYRALLAANVCRNTKLYPDPAFLLEACRLPLPIGFAENNTVGINVSPLMAEYERNPGIAFRNIRALIRHILRSTGMQIALIPHVVDADILESQKFYDLFRDTGRVVLVGGHNCMELKGYISRCRVFLCARTHASIAAYSTCVPTLAIGYSVKAKGIAKDIFGTDEHYVVPVQSFRSDDDLIEAFDWLMLHEAEIRNHLRTFMPSYCAKVLEAAKEIGKVTRGIH